MDRTDAVFGRRSCGSVVLGQSQRSPEGRHGGLLPLWTVPDRRGMCPAKKPAEKRSIKRKNRRGSPRRFWLVQICCLGLLDQSGGIRGVAGSISLGLPCRAGLVHSAAPPFPIANASCGCWFTIGCCGDEPFQSRRCRAALPCGRGRADDRKKHPEEDPPDVLACAILSAWIT